MMKQIKNMAICLVTLVGFYACNGKRSETETSKSTEIVKTGGKVDEVSSDMPPNNRWAARRAKGDTLAMSYKDLQAYLPDISGYTKEGGPTGSQVNMPGMGSWSETEQKYNSGEKNVTVKMMDYNASYQTFQGLTMAYSMGFTVEDDDKKQSKMELGEKDAAAYGTIYKKDNRSEIVVVVADRFLITIDSNGNNDEAFIKSVAKSIDLQKLATL
jgi:hypothetical protein